MRKRKAYIVLENRKHIGDGYWWYAEHIESVWDAEYKAEERVKRLKEKDQISDYYFKVFEMGFFIDYDYKMSV